MSSISSNSSLSYSNGSLTSMIGGEQSTMLLEALKSHWSQINSIIFKNPSPATAEQVIIVSRHADQMMALLLVELNDPSTGDHTIELRGAKKEKQKKVQGPLLDFLLTESVLEKIILWLSLSLDTDLELHVSCLKSGIKIFDSLVNQPKQHCLLVHKPLLTPMLRLLKDCAHLSSSNLSLSLIADLEYSFVLLLNQICVKISENNEDLHLLEFCFKPNDFEDREERFLVFTLLIPYLYRAGNTGQLCKDAILLILSVSRRLESVAKFVADSSFCPVLATGLSALLSSLPHNLHKCSEDWHTVVDSDLDSCSELKLFYNAIEFCNAVVQVANEVIIENILDYIYNGFLVSVMSPALSDNSEDALIASVAYFDLLFRAVTEPIFVKILFKFLLTEKCSDDINSLLIDRLITKISSNSRISLVTLSFFETLLSFHCEDFMFELVLKYLIPGTHLMVTQKSDLFKIPNFGRQLWRSSDQFVSLIPRCFMTSSSAMLERQNYAINNDDKRLSPADSAGSLEGVNPDQEIHFKNSIHEKKRDSIDDELVFEYDVEYGLKPLQTSYLDYLSESRSKVQYALDACHCWSAPYDGVIPDPKHFRSSSYDSCISTSSSSSINEESKAKMDPMINQNSVVDHKINIFSRNTSYRKSRTNRYYSAGRSSLVPTAEEDENNKSSDKMTQSTQLRDLVLGDADYATQMEDLLIKGNKKDKEQIISDKDEEINRSSPNSLESTTRHGNDSKLAMPVDYFKISYAEFTDDDSTSPPNVNNNSSFQNRSDSETDTGDSYNGRFILRGWNRIHDQNTFLEMLKRIKPDHQSSHETLNELINFVIDTHKFLFGVGDYDENQQQQSLKEQHVTNSEAEKLESELIDSKDSGFDQIYPINEEEQTINDKKTNIEFGPIVSVLHVKRSSFSSPDIGPFLTVLLHKLDNMCQNSLYTNFHLTGVISSLAAYPMAVIFGFLLDCELVCQPSVRSLYQVLSALRLKIDNYACTMQNFQLLETKFYKKGKKKSLPKALPQESEKRGSVKNSIVRFFNLSRVKEPSFNAAPEHRTQEKVSDLQLNSNVMENNFGLSTSNEKETNIVYCAIILESFLKELASLAQEHSLRYF
uniref:FHF complex subunit HOOK-interacting protein C-terminal domain-containing protein n=1 Tax=Romanomermis culicivorax TaxID=13658 RepID=A0A915HNX3_ROMCU